MSEPEGLVSATWDEFLHSIEPLLKAVEGFCEVSSRLMMRPHAVPSLDSVAMNDLSVESRWTAPGRAEPVLRLQSIANLAAVASVGHLSAAGVLLRRGGPPTLPYTLNALYRAAIEAARPAYALTEAVPLDVRLRRSLCEQLFSARETEKLGGSPGEKGADTAARLEAEAAYFNWVVRPGAGSAPVVGGIERMTPRQFVASVLTDDVAKTVWAVLCAYAHSTSYALLQGLSPVNGPTGTQGTFRTTSKELSLWLSSASACVLWACRQFAIYSGWDTVEFREANDALIQQVAGVLLAPSQ